MTLWLVQINLQEGCQTAITDTNGITISAALQ